MLSTIIPRPLSESNFINPEVSMTNNSRDKLPLHVLKATNLDFLSHKSVRCQQQVKGAD